MADWPGGEEPGRVMMLDGELAVATGQGALLLKEVQLEGRRAMAAQEFLRGRKDFVGSVL